MNIKQILKTIVKAVMTVVAIKSVNAQDDYERVWCPFTDNCPPFESCEVQGQTFLDYGLSFKNPTSNALIVNDTQWRYRSFGAYNDINPNGTFHIAGVLTESAYIYHLSDGTADYMCTYFAKRDFSKNGDLIYDIKYGRSFSLKTTLKSYYSLPHTFHKYKIDKYKTHRDHFHWIGGSSMCSGDYGDFREPMLPETACNRRGLLIEDKKDLEEKWQSSVNTCDVIARKFRPSFFKEEDTNKKQTASASMCLVL